MGDMIQVVRCKDCVYCHAEGEHLLCDYHYGTVVVEYNDFCSRGVRAEDDLK